MILSVIGLQGIRATDMHKRVILRDMYLILSRTILLYLSDIETASDILPEAFYFCNAVST